MATDRKLDDTFRDLKTSISNSLATIVKKELNIRTDKERAKVGLTAIMDKKKALEDKVQSLEGQIVTLEDELRVKDNRFNNLSTKQERELDLTSMQRNFMDYNATYCKAKAIKTMANTKEWKNYLAYKTIEDNMEYMYGMAVSVKEKRNIIMGLQSRDWRSLGIAIPQLPAFSEFDIKDGVIRIPEDHLLTAGNPDDNDD